MPTLKSRNLKKLDSYEKDHRVRAENPHAFRKNWPKKKARIRRGVRHREKKLLVDEANGNLEDLASNVRNVPAFEKAKKDGVMTLRSWIADRKSKRADSAFRKSQRRTNARNATT